MLFPLMSIDLGAKAAFINPDEKTAAFARSVSSFENLALTTERSGCSVRKGHRHRSGRS